MKTNFCEVQNENYASVGYNTYAFNSNNGHKFGFVCININQEFVCHVSFNDLDSLRLIDDYADDYYTTLVNLHIGECTTIDDAQWIRCW